MTATTLPAEIVAFAAAVRAALADLPTDEVEELTEGLEADLAEAYAEDLARELPDPSDYAAELRGAAGLPTPDPQSRPRRLGAIVESFAEMGRDINRSLRQSPLMESVLDFLVTLRPAWWIVRGWAAYQTSAFIVGMWKTDVLPQHPWGWIVLVVMVVGSVVVGLRSWPAWARFLIVLGNVFAVIMLFAAFGNVTTGAELQRAYDQQNVYYDDDSGMQGDGTGVWSNGSEVTNIFAYDAQGALVSGVQLFDQDGKPIATSVPGGNGCLVPMDEYGECSKPGAWTPAQLETGATVWNVYPMKMAESSFEDPTTPITGAEPQDRSAPFLKVPALMTVAQDQAPADEDEADPDATTKKSPE